MPTIHESHETARGCGFRRGGGLYLVSGGLSEPCPKLPIELHVCPTCGGGVKQTRGFTWITPDPLLDPGPHGSEHHEVVCPLGTAIDWSGGKRCGLIWIGESFYATPDAFMEEAGAMGVSRRISAVPREFVVGETWVALAHPKAIHHPEDDEWRAGVFTFFRPSAIEYIVKGDETDEELERLEERGFRLVRVVRVGEQQALDEDAA